MVADEGDGVFVGVAGVHLEGAVAGPHEAIGTEVVAALFDHGGEVGVGRGLFPQGVECGGFESELFVDG